MTEDQKLEEIKKLTNYPRFSEQKDQGERLLACPFYGCMKQYQTGSLLKSHVNRSHKQMQESGYFTVDTNTGEIKLSSEILDYVLR